VKKLRNKMLKLFYFPLVRNSQNKVILPHISNNYSDNKSTNGASPPIMRRSKLGAGDRLERLLKNTTDNDETGDISTKSEDDIARDSQRQVPLRLRRRSLSPTMRLESLMKDGNDKNDKQ